MPLLFSEHRVRTISERHIKVRLNAQPIRDLLQPLTTDTSTLQHVQTLLSNDRHRRIIQPRNSQQPARRARMNSTIQRPLRRIRHHTGYQHIRKSRIRRHSTLVDWCLTRQGGKQSQKLRVIIQANHPTYQPACQVHAQDSVPHEQEGRQDLRNHHHENRRNSRGYRVRHHDGLCLGPPRI